MADNPLAGFLTAARPDPRAEGRSQIDAILEAVRQHLGMEIAFASRFVPEGRQFTHISADISVPAAPGDCEPLEQTFCHHIVEGRLPQLIHDAADIPFALTLPITAALPVGAHVNVPLRLRDGSLYGTFCCLSRSADHSLTERDLNTVRAFADLACEQIEQQLEQERGHSETLARISEVIARDRLALEYQPIVDLKDNKVVGVEALARFPDRAVRPPSDWFAEAGGVGLGVELELLAVREALRALPLLPSSVYLAVNVSPAVVMSGKLEALLTGQPEGRVVVEVTEHDDVADAAAFTRALAPLRRLCSLAIDDVGAGYSGLRRILELDPDIIKLDMSLTRNIDSDSARRVLAKALVSFARAIECRMVAEGIESQREIEALRTLGVGYGQGFALGRPMPLVAIQQRCLGSADIPVAAPVAPLPRPDQRAAG